MTEKVALVLTKKLSSQILRYFFCDQTIKIIYGKGAMIFGQSFGVFGFWTKINVHFQKSEQSFEKISSFAYIDKEPLDFLNIENLKIPLHDVGTHPFSLSSFHIIYYFK